VRREQQEGGQVQRAAAELVESARKPQGDLGDPGALVGRILAVAQAVAAVGDEIGACLLEVEPPPLDLDQVLDHRGGGFSFRTHEERQPFEQLRVGQARDSLHGSRLSCVFRRAPQARRTRFAIALAFEVVCARRSERWTSARAGRSSFRTTR
jgi:hypothetical protein